VSLPRKLPYAIDTAADLDLGKKALEALLQAMDPGCTTVAVTPAFQAPLARLADWHGERSGLFLAGRTGSLKSSFIQVVMSMYGAGFMRDDMLIKWGEGARRNAIMALATHAGDLPLLIDNYKPSTGGGARDLINLIHNILEGGEKDRLNRAAALRESKPISCWPLITGEDVPDQDPASLARMLVVQMPWPPGKPNDTLAEAQRLAPHLSALGKSWLEWLESEEGQARAREAAELFPVFRAQWAAELRKIRPEIVNILRVSSNLAAMN
jgi:hypothetical protein